MKFGPSSLTRRSAPIARALFLVVVAAVGTACAPTSLPRPEASAPAVDGATLARAGKTREAFVAYLAACAPRVAWEAADDGRLACAAAFDLRAEATSDELERWREIASDVCAGAPSSASIAVCRAVADLSLSGPMEDTALARDALSHGCHVHADYAACVRLEALGGGVRVASVSWL